MRGYFRERARRLFARPAMLSGQDGFDTLAYLRMYARQPSAGRRLVYAQHSARLAQAQPVEVVELDEQAVFRTQLLNRTRERRLDIRARSSLGEKPSAGEISSATPVRCFEATASG